MTTLREPLFPKGMSHAVLSLRLKLSDSVSLPLLHLGPWGKEVNSGEKGTRFGMLRGVFCVLAAVCLGKPTVAVGRKRLGAKDGGCSIDKAWSGDQKGVLCKRNDLHFLKQATSNGDLIVQNAAAMFLYAFGPLYAGPRGRTRQHRRGHSSPMESRMLSIQSANASTAELNDILV